MNLKTALLHALEEKQIALFEKKRKGDRATDRHYVQLLSTMDDLARQKTHETSRSKKTSRKRASTSD